MSLSTNKIFTKDFTLHFISYFLMATAFYFLLPTLPVYAVNALGANKNQVGYIIGVYALSALIIRPFCGYALDAVGRRSVYLWALAIFTVLMGLYHLSSTFIILLIIRAMHGFAWGTITTGGSTIAADLIPENRRGEGIGYFGLAMTMAIALAPYGGDQIMGQNNFSNLFTIAFIVSLASLILALFIKVPKIKTGETKISVGKMFDKRVNRIAIVMMTGAFPYAAIISFIRIYSDELGLKQGALFFIFMAIGVAIARLSVGKIMDKHGPSLLVTIGLLVTVGGLIWLAYVDSFWPFMMVGVLVGIGNGIIMPTVQTMALNMVPLDRRGAANATFFSAVDLGIGSGSIALGYVAEYYGISMMFLICGFILLFPLAFYFLFVRRHYFEHVAILKKDQENA
ncbi:MFS transporter [Roseivirga sp.]|uniref:MFS transporter n=1 Tax=Roseivirga sp. TaxID=1964215 RepID=UPI003B8D650E